MGVMGALSLVLNNARWRSQDRVAGKLLVSETRRDRNATMHWRLNLAKELK